MTIQLVCLLLVLLSAAAFSQPPDVLPRYKKFIEQHVNRNIPANGCDSVINGKGISKTNSNECKESNTFIKANLNTIRDICRDAGEPYGTMTRSIQPFSIIHCQLLNYGGRLRHCQYRGQARTRRIAINCDRTWPVHYDGDIVYFQN